MTASQPPPAGAADVQLRPATAEDAEEIRSLSVRTFSDLAARFARPPPHPPTPERRTQAVRRIAHLITTDPDLAHVAVGRGGRIVGAGIGARREGMYLLSLLVVDPELLARGVGTRLMAASVPPGEPGLIAASPDARALRLYATNGFQPVPTFAGIGHIRTRPRRHPAVRDGAHDDPILTGADRHGRGASRAVDLQMMLPPQAQLRVLPGRGYAITTELGVSTVAALDDESAATLLTDALARFEEGAEPDLLWLRGEQQWAVEVLLGAGMTLRPDGALCSRKVPLASSYLPSGPYL